MTIFWVVPRHSIQPTKSEAPRKTTTWRGARSARHAPGGPAQARPPQPRSPAAGWRSSERPFSDPISSENRGEGLPFFLGGDGGSWVSDPLLPLFVFFWGGGMFFVFSPAGLQGGRFPWLFFGGSRVKIGGLSRCQNGTGKWGATE